MSLKSDWNYVKRAMRTPCQNGNIGAYFETGLNAAGIAALDVISFGCREPLKHAAGRGQLAEWFGTGNRRGVFPSGHRKPRTGGGLKPPTLKAGRSFFWQFEGLFERALFMMMLAEVGKDFFLNWHSLLNAANGCDGQPAGYCEFNIQPQIVGPGQDTELLIGALPDCHGVLSDIRHIFIPQGLTATIGYHASAVPWAPANTPYATLSTFLQDSNDGGAWAASQQDPPGSGSGGVVGFQHNLPGVTIGYRKLAVVGRSDGYVFITKGTIQVTLQGHEVEWFHPNDCFKNIFGDPTRGDGFFASRPPHGGG